MNKILVPTDFSPTSMKAVSYAAEIAKKLNANIFLLHVVDNVTDIIIEPLAFDVKEQDVILKNSLKNLDELKQSIVSTYPEITVEAGIVSGRAILSILNFSEEYQADLIVMGTTGAGAVKELLMGSVASGIISKTKIPVITVPAGYELYEPGTILFATNHFEETKGTLDMIARLATLFSSQIKVVVFVDENEAMEYIKNQKKLDHYLEYLKRTFPTIRFKAEVLEGKKFEHTIELYEERNEVDIIAMITYPKNLLERLFNKSMTKKMAIHSTIPLLAIPAKT